VFLIPVATLLVTSGPSRVRTRGDLLISRGARKTGSGGEGSLPPRPLTTEQGLGRGDPSRYTVVTQQCVGQLQAYI